MTRPSHLVLLCLFAVSLCGCRFFRDPRTVLDATETWSVLPSNGVWDVEYGRTDDPRDCSFSFRLVRYADGIGVEASVRDDAVVVDDCPPGAVTCASWNDDTLQCFFDGDNDRASDSYGADGRVACGGEYTLVANGSAQSDHSSCPRGFGDDWTGTVVQTPVDGGVRLDYRLWFSWKCLGLARAPGRSEDVTFGFNICVHDDDDGGRCDRALYWRGTPTRPYRNERLFAPVTLKGKFL